MKALYQIQAKWEVVGTITVEAESLSEAIEKALDADTNKYTTEYVDDTYELDSEFLEDTYQGLGKEYQAAKKEHKL